jgi:hypothetical protein
VLYGDRFALSTILHLDPFHRSARVFPGPSPCECMPTAVQLVEVTQETPNSTTFEAPSGVGLGGIDQFVPSQCSINAWS